MTSPLNPVPGSKRRAGERQVWGEGKWEGSQFNPCRGWEGFERGPVVFFGQVKGRLRYRKEQSYCRDECAQTLKEVCRDVLTE